MIENTFHSAFVIHPDRMVRWNINNYNCFVLNVDGSCLGTPMRATSDILFAELTVIHRGLLLAVETGIEEMVYYSDSLAFHKTSH
jgi:hypothetical protein